jgi:hypothetical protein
MLQPVYITFKSSVLDLRFSFEFQIRWKSTDVSEEDHTLHLSVWLVPHTKHCISITNTNKSLLFRQIIYVDYENDTKYINALLIHNNPDRVQTTTCKTTRELSIYHMIIIS